MLHNYTVNGTVLQPRRRRAEFDSLPRWYLGATDADFYQCDVTESIKIEATVSPVPEVLRPENQFGLYQRGLDESGELYDEHEPCLTIRLVVDDSLEPTWEVVTDRHSEGRRISTRQRSMVPRRIYPLRLQ